MVEAYGPDLAHIHDAGFGHFARNAAPVLLETLRRSDKNRGLVVELGCGSAIFSQIICEAGYDVLGFDLSEAMIELARARVPEGQFQVASLLDAGLPPCVAVAAIGECINYTFDDRNTKKEFAKLFTRIHGALQPGGVLLFDAAGPGRASVPSRGFVEHEGWAVLYGAEEDRRRRVLTRRITSFRKVGDLYRREHEVHLLRLFDPVEIATLLRKIGFQVRTLRRYGVSKLPQGYTAFLARKRS